MISKEKNDEITLIGSDQPAGKLLRQYWMPAALTDELEGERPVVPVRLLGEDLTLFRNEDGTLGLIDRHCPHRGADMCYGRLEDGGLRCPFHGWHFDTSGQCLEQPGEPEGSTTHKNIKTTSYPVIEKNGIIFAFMGQGKPPAFPNLDCFSAPDTHVFAFKGLWQCNWLQALEVGIDPAHASFLHRFLQDEDAKDSYGKQFRDNAPGTNIPITKVLREFPSPQINVEDTAFGMRLTSLRDLKNGSTHVRITNQVFPCAITIPMSAEMNITQWHVPIDDENCYWYSMFTSFGAPVDKKTMREQRLKEHTLPDYASIKNKSNSYGYSATEQKTETYTGLGMDINVHDQWACESMGTIQDRTKEHLGKTDIAIIHNRRKLRKAIAAVAQGNLQDIPMGGPANEIEAITGPIALDTIAPSNDWQGSWQQADEERRKNCDWIKT